MMLLIYGVVVVLSFLTTPTTAVFQSTYTVETTIRIDMNEDVDSHQPPSSLPENAESSESDEQDSPEVDGDESVEE